jgi:hypothetical protein
MRSVFALVLMLACAAASADVYKWKDQNGVWHYGDKPKHDAQQVEIKPDSGTAEPSVAEADRQGRDKECQDKKAQLEGWRKSTKMSEVDSLGREREFTKEERAQFMALQEKKMQEICARPPTPEAEGSFPPPPPAEAPPPAPSEDAPSPSRSTY